MSKLNEITLKGFRSIVETTIELQSLNVLIGANGAGKSNLIAFFKMLNEMMAGRLQQFVASTGRGTANLYFGPKVTPQIEAELSFSTETGIDTYKMRLFHAAGDSLIFAEEDLFFTPFDSDLTKHVALGAGHRESLIGDKAAEGEPTAKTLRYLLNRCRVYHFHDTSATARVRQYCYVGDHRWLMPDAANLAAILYRLQQEKEAVYQLIVSTIRLIAPFFVDFVLAPTGQYERDIILNWRHRNSDLVFGPHQLSDGTLRAICLVSLLSQPSDDLPSLIVIDEPELGLHPYALSIIAGLIDSASERCQVVVSTQSVTLLDHFEIQDIVVVNRRESQSVFERLDPNAFTEWLDDYSTGELWQKNVVQGGPNYD